MSRKYWVTRIGGKLAVMTHQLVKVDHPEPSLGTTVILRLFPEDRPDIAQRYVDGLNTVHEVVQDTDPQSEGEVPILGPDGVYLIWHQEVGKDSRPFLKTGFQEYEAAKKYCLEHVQKHAELYGTVAQHGSTENGGLEYFEVIAANWYPETDIKVKHRWTVKRLRFGYPM